MPQRVLRIPGFIPFEKVSQYSSGQLAEDDPEYPIAVAWAKLFALGNAVEPEKILDLHKENTRLKMENVALRQAFSAILEAEGARHLVN